MVGKKHMFDRIDKCAEFSPLKRYPSNRLSIQAALELCVNGMVNELIARCEDEVAHLSRLGEHLSFCRGPGKRLLHKNMLLCVKRKPSELRQQCNRRHHCHCFNRGRDWNRQGVVCAGYSLFQPESQQTVRMPELRSSSVRFGGE